MWTKYSPDTFMIYITQFIHIIERLYLFYLFFFVQFIQLVSSSSPSPSFQSPSYSSIFNVISPFVIYLQNHELYPKLSRFAGIRSPVGRPSRDKSVNSSTGSTTSFHFGRYTVMYHFDKSLRASCTERSTSRPT